MPIFPLLYSTITNGLKMSLPFLSIFPVRTYSTSCLVDNIRTSLLSFHLVTTIPSSFSRAFISPFFICAFITSAGRPFLFALTVPTRWVLLAKRFLASCTDV
ncbi:hypothetical protein J6590_108670 [Homalodisca vitripennis]|nr:hypothetical protein J6590_108568 [Homalodisca vitripennis]KAG8279799.1 hypothetical protein J6590_108670 [Homalodisca vitripennis]